MNMLVESTSRSPHQIVADALILFVPEEGIQPGSPLDLCDVQSNGYFRQMWQREELSGKQLKCCVVQQVPGIESPKIVVVGTGKGSKIDTGIAYRAAASGARSLLTKQLGTIAMAVDYLDERQQSASIAGLISATQGQDLYKAKKSIFAPNIVQVAGAEENALKEGRIIGESVNLTRLWVNEPPNRLFPERFCELAVKELESLPIEIEIWDESRLRKERCDALLAVGAASRRSSRLMILKYAGDRPNSPPLALVGKGVTFDSGGLSIKPTDSMTTMKCDMAGAATVVSAIRCAAQLKLSQPIVGLVGLVENMLGGSAFKLGDVLTSRSGKTIEILNTDAEGRVVLADVLDVAKQFQPSQLIDLATLTGACVVALGTEIAGIMTNDESWQEEVRSAAFRAGELLWPLPMHSFFSEQISSKIADIKNTGDGRWGGAITAAKFLEEFVGDTPWCHLDIAGPAFFDSPKPWADAGGTGVMLRTLVELIRTRP